MLTINKTNIDLTRGDSAYITIEVTDAQGVPLELTSRDIIRVQVRYETDGGRVLFDGQIHRSDEGILWHIRPEDTDGVEPMDYVWDAQVEFADGDIFTFIPVSRFRVLSEVTEVD